MAGAEDYRKIANQSKTSNRTTVRNEEYGVHFVLANLTANTHVYLLLYLVAQYVYNAQ